MKIINARLEKDDLFELTNILSADKKCHHPYIIIDGEKEEIIIETKLEKVILYPDNTKILWQWGGNYSSDFFETSVGSIKNKIQERGGFKR